MYKNNSSLKAMINMIKIKYVMYFILIIFISLSLIFYLKTSKTKDKKYNPVVVSVAAAKTKDIPVYITALGLVIPMVSVVVKPQVNGQLLKVYFKEGDWVKKGDLLAEIDSKPYEAQSLQAQGQLAKDTALLTDAQLDLKRYQTLWEKNSISKQTLDTQASLVKQYQGTVTSDQGALENARVNLAYCRLNSPLDGRTGVRMIDPGNIVQTTDTNGLVVVNTVHPIQVQFSIAEDNIQPVLTKIRKRQDLVVEAYDRGQEKLLKTGKLSLIDNQIDTTTGTVKLKANFSNKDEILFPNQFVNIQLRVEEIKNATIIPTQAIQQGTQGAYVYVLKDSQTVHIVPIKTSVTNKEDTVVLSGISPGQLVVIEGTDKLTDGASVKATHGKKVLIHENVR